MTNSNIQVGDLVTIIDPIKLSKKDNISYNRNYIAFPFIVKSVNKSMCTLHSVNRSYTSFNSKIENVIPVNKISEKLYEISADGDGEIIEKHVIHKFSIYSGEYGYTVFIFDNLEYTELFFCKDSKVFISCQLKYFYHFNDALDFKIKCMEDKKRKILSEISNYEKQIEKLKDQNIEMQTTIDAMKEQYATLAVQNGT